MLEEKMCKMALLGCYNNRQLAIILLLCITCVMYTVQIKPCIVIITCLDTCCKHPLIWYVVWLCKCCITIHDQCYNSDWYYRGQLRKTNPSNTGVRSGITSQFGGVGFPSKWFSILKVNRRRLAPCRRSRLAGGSECRWLKVLFRLQLRRTLG